MSTVTINGSSIGNALQAMMVSADIVPGADPSYQLCKTLYLFHPIAHKLTDTPIKMAQSQKREIKVPKSPETRVVEAYWQEWERIGADKHIFNLGRLSRMYGIASLALLIEGVETDVPLGSDKLPLDNLWKSSISFNAYDPLNTAGSLVLNQNPNAADFQHVTDIVVQGKVYHRSRTCVLLNAQPIYIGYTTSAFGYVGTSVFQRALFPMKSFIQTMITDDMVARKAGVIVAFIKAAGSIANKAMGIFTGQKRDVVKEAETNNVISVTPDDRIELIDLKNLSEPLKIARTDIVENIALAADMPAKIINAETFAEGFGEGTEDAKHVAGYVDTIRRWLGPAYAFFDNLVQHRAWNPEFYATLQKDYPELKGVPYKQFFYDAVNSFEASWPSLLTEPPSEKIKVDDVKLKAIIAFVEVLAPMLDPENKAMLIDWAVDNLNEMKLLFGSKFAFDSDAFANYVPPEPPKMVGEAPPFSARDSQPRKGKKSYDDAVAGLLALMEKREAPSQGALALPPPLRVVQ